MYKIFFAKHFKRQLKRFVKKDRFLLTTLIDILQRFDHQKSIAIGHDVYKVRIAREGQGKSSGYRIYILVKRRREILAPLCIYAKNEEDSVSLGVLADHLSLIEWEIEMEFR